jgi:predicted dehydrogenase
MENEQDVTRREFLKTAATAAAASSLAGLGAPTILTAQSAGNPVRYGIIGTGTEGCTLLKFLATILEGQCIATCDIYPPNLKKGVETIGSNPETYVEYRKMLERKDMDAVLIATPLNLHTQMVVDSLNAGKHVFVEKTMYFKEEEGEMIRKAMADNPKLVLQVGLQRRSSVLYQVAMEMIRKGALGKVMFVRAQWHRNNNWRRPVPDAKFERLINWRMYKEYSGGLLAELASHQIDIANWAIGSEPISVYATGGINYWKDGRETCDNVEAIYEYPGGQKLVWSSILCNAHFEFNEQIMGDQGTLIITLGKGLYYREAVAKVSAGNVKENWWAGATVANTAPQQAIPIFIEQGDTSRLGFMDREVRYAKHWLASMGIYNYEEPHDPWWSEMHNFLLSVRDGKPIIAPFHLGLADAQGVIYGNRSVETGQRVYWPGAEPQKEAKKPSAVA